MAYSYCSWSQDSHSIQVSRAGPAATAVESNFFSALSDDEDDGDDLHTLHHCDLKDAYVQVPYPDRCPEVAMVGAGQLHQELQDTDRLKVMTYKEAMATNQIEEWEDAVLEEFMRFAKHEALQVVPKSKVPPGSQILTTVWAMKQKANGKYRARLNMRGFEQVKGVHYDPAWTSAPVAGATTIRIVMILMLMAGWYAHIVDVMGAFLLGRFQNGEQIYTNVPLGWEPFFPVDVLLLLLRTIYGLKQAANCFYILLVSTMRAMMFTKSHGDPALFFKWQAEKGLIISLSWTDDLICFGLKEVVLDEVNNIKTKFEVDDVGQLTDYLGCKIEITPDDDPTKPSGLTFVQSVILETLFDKFHNNGKESITPTYAGA